MHVSNCYETLKINETCPFMLNFVYNCYKFQENFEKTVSKETFMLKYCLGKCKSQ